MEHYRHGLMVVQELQHITLCSHNTGGVSLNPTSNISFSYFLSFTVPGTQNVVGLEINVWIILLLYYYLFNKYLKLTLL